MSFFALTKRKPEIADHQDRLSEALELLVTYGVPWLHWCKWSNGWRASCDMRTTIPGANFEIKSETHKTPLAAVNEVISKANQALSANK
jgi:hypothetical protein